MEIGHLNKTPTAVACSMFTHLLWYMSVTDRCSWCHRQA